MSSGQEGMTDFRVGRVMLLRRGKPQRVAAALGTGGAEPGEVCIADLGAEAVRSLVASAGVIHRDST
jgi:hypothetical protein